MSKIYSVYYIYYMWSIHNVISTFLCNNHSLEILFMYLMWDVLEINKNILIAQYMDTHNHIIVIHKYLYQIFHRKIFPIYNSFYN